MKTVWERSGRLVEYLTGYRPAQVRKAVAGGAAATIPLLATDLVDLHVSRPELGGLVSAFVAGTYLVFKVRNGKGRHTAGGIGTTGNPGVGTEPGKYEE